MGAKDYLVKPYKPSQLSKVIMHTLLSNGKQGQILIPQAFHEEQGLKNKKTVIGIQNNKKMINSNMLEK
ncbi:hypothetical protein [Peribacillus simplex]|uniref:hypothetical protein n=1 Tax=Peribacillus simplex TaxID=1478 RepID=UPI003672F2CF